MVIKCYPKFWDFCHQFWPLSKKWLVEFVILLFYFQNLLTGLFIKSISLCTSSTCSLVSCYSFSSFSKFEEADASSGLEAGIRFAFFGFLACGGSEDWCLGAMLEKKKSQESSQGRREVLQAQRTQTFLFLSFILKYRLRGSFKIVPSSPV